MNGTLNPTAIYFLNLYSNSISNFYCHVLIFFHCDFKSRRSPSIPPPAPNILDMALGRFFIKSSGEVNGIASPLLLADLGSLRSVKATNTYLLPSWRASILETMKSFFIAHNLHKRTYNI